MTSFYLVSCRPWRNSEVLESQREPAAVAVAVAAISVNAGGKKKKRVKETRKKR